MAFMRDQFAQAVERASACLLRCYPHEWSVLLQPKGEEWKYIGRFSARPSPQQIEDMCRDGMSKLRFAAPPPGAD
eukprot:1111122-Prymnesium_polylepis.1